VLNKAGKLKKRYSWNLCDVFLFIQKNMNMCDCYKISGIMGSNIEET
jgi:hypothetical protein